MDTVPLGSLWSRLHESLACVLPLDEAEWDSVKGLSPEEQLYQLGIKDVILEVVDSRGEVLGIGPLILTLHLMPHLSSEEVYFRKAGALST